MLKKLPKPAIIAHRGACAYAPENTLSAFELAVQQQADAIELDVQLSADDHIIVIHDKTVNRTTDGEGLISNLPLKTLKELDAGSAYDDAFKKIFINVELKSLLTSKKLTEKVAKCVRDHNMASRVLFSSFNPIALIQIAKLLPQTPRGLLVYSGPLGVLARTRFGELVPHQSLHINLQGAKQDLVDRAHRQGRSVLVYTVNHPADIQRLVKLGIDGFFTNDPHLARTTVAKIAAK
ncbi:MAG: hypothetical protein B5M51_08340 [Anaerolinea sp. 4484_236]|nr:MAG: hypothetical protein B5M51_08340 [Anaerolinea sp. 4484_236]